MTCLVCGQSNDVRPVAILYKFTEETQAATPQVLLCTSCRADRQKAWLENREHTWDAKHVWPRLKPPR